MESNGKFTALRTVCEAIANKGDVIRALVTAAAPNAEHDLLPYRLLLDHSGQFRVEVAREEDWRRPPSQFKVVVKPAPLEFLIVLPPHFASAEAVEQLAARTGRRYDDLALFRHVFGILFTMLISRQLDFLRALKDVYAFLPPEVSFHVSTEDHCADPETVTFCRPKNLRNVLLPDIYYYFSNAYDAHKQAVTISGKKWSERLDRVIWRGSTTGSHPTVDQLFENPRVALTVYCARRPEIFDVKLTAIVQAPPGQVEEIRRILTAQGLMTGWMHMARFADYKFALNIDGNASAFGFFEKLSLGCCVLQVESPYEEWFEPRLKAWEHFVPVARDLSDLNDKAEFLLKNPALAERIAQAGFEFTMTADLHHEAGHFIRQLASSFNVQTVTLRLQAPNETSASMPPEQIEANWHGVECHANGPNFRWTKTALVSWPINVDARHTLVLEVVIPLFGPPWPGYLEACRLRLGNQEVPLRVDHFTLRAAVPVEAGCSLREVTLTTPAPIRPSDMSDSQDTRSLGLAVLVE